MSTNESSAESPKESEGGSLSTVPPPPPAQPSGDEAPVSTPETPTSSSGASFGGWFTSIVQSAKDTVSKSAGNTLENIKRDLSELKDAVQNDATSMVYSTGSFVKTKLNEIGNTVNEIGSLGTNEEEEEGDLEDKSERSGKEAPVAEKRQQKLSSSRAPSKEEDQTAEDSSETEDQLPFNMETLNNWTNMITDRAKSTLSMVKESEVVKTLVDSIFINRDFLIDELNEEPYVLKDGQVVPIANWRELLRDLQTNADTYCREPTGPPEEFDLWLTKFNLMNYQKQMEHLLGTMPEMLKYHSNLVPQELSDSDFWHRYYYKVHQLREEQKRLILESDEPIVTGQESTANSPVNIKYLNEKSGSADSESKISRSSTEDWDKVSNAEPVGAESSKSTSDEECRDWVKCD